MTPNHRVWETTFGQIEEMACELILQAKLEYTSPCLLVGQSLRKLHISGMMLKSRARFCSQNKVPHYDQVLKPTYWLLPKENADAPICDFRHYSHKSTWQVTRLVDYNTLPLYDGSLHRKNRLMRYLYYKADTMWMEGYTKLGELSATYKIQKYNLIYLFCQFSPQSFFWWCHNTEFAHVISV